MVLKFDEKYYLDINEHPTLSSIKKELEGVADLRWEFLKENTPFIKNMRKELKIDVPDSNKLAIVLIGFSNNEIKVMVILAVDLNVSYHKYSPKSANLGQYLTGLGAVDITKIHVIEKHRGQGLAKQFLTAVWKEHIPLTIQPINGLKNFFKGMEPANIPNTKNYMYSTVNEFINLFHSARRDQGYRLTPYELLSASIEFEKFNKPPLFIKSFIPDETLLVKFDDGHVTPSNIIIVMPTESSYVYQSMNPETGKKYLVPLEQLLNSIGCHSGLLRLDEGMGYGDPYVQFDSKQYPLFRRINIENLMKFIKGDSVYSKIINNNFNPLEVAVEMHNKFEEYNQLLMKQNPWAWD